MGTDDCGYPQDLNFRSTTHVRNLSRFAQAPDHQHYNMALKNVRRYLLRRTKDWGLIYWREHPLESLSQVPLDQPALDESRFPFPTQSPLALIGFVDPVHTTDVKTRRSATGWVFTFAGGAVAYKSKLQTAVATSSTIRIPGGCACCKDGQLPTLRSL
jgi:hypothetical protein